ncbi:MAG: Patatin [Acidimicrobiales bacterium]|nr:Patatin [Acidimicrobiales bacterium]
MTRVGLVLGAGGIVGQAYHAGVLAALERELGWDPRTADVVVGSSAGSLTGVALRLGVPASDLAAAGLGEELSTEGAFLAAFADESPVIPPYDARKALRPWRLPSLDLVTRTARRPWAFRPSVAAMTMLPAGFVDLEQVAEALTPHLGDSWPDGLYICAARRSDGVRTVFGRQVAPEARLGAAVAASCAIPSYFAPVEIGGVEYFDGGVHSPTNADVLCGEQFDVVIVSSPMSVAHGRTVGPDAAFRWAAHRRLEREVRRLQGAGTAVVRIEPSRRVRDAMGMNAMAGDRSADIVREAIECTSRYLEASKVTERLAPLRQPPLLRAA